MAAKCSRCSTRVHGRDLCRPCARDVRRGDVAGGNDYERSAHVYECLECETEYVSDGFPRCPECGAKRRRYAGEPEERDADLPRVDPGGQGGVEA